MTDSVIIVLMDDESTNITPYMSQAVDLASNGITFSSHIISSPVCSPSRASLLRSQYCHNTGVIANDYPRGGYGVFGPLEGDTLLTRMQDAGYYVAFCGKYENHYDPIDGNDKPNQGFLYDPLHVPPGVDDAFLLNEKGYAQWNWKAVQVIGGGSATVVDVSGGGYTQEEYANRHIFDFAVDCIGRAKIAGKPLFLLVCPFSTHSGGTSNDPEGLKFHPDPLDRELTDDRPVDWDPPLFPGGNCGDPGDGGCSLVENPGNGDESFNVPTTNPLAWERLVPFGPTDLASFLNSHKNRIRMAQGIDRGVIDLRAELVAQSVDGTTHFVLTSDNGFHLGEHAMPQAKSSPFDCDVLLTLIWNPPGGTTPATIGAPYIVQNVDYMPTCLDIAGVAEDPDLDGRSLLPFIEGSPPDPEDWRTTGLVEFCTDGPDFSDLAGTGQAPSSRTLRSADWAFFNFYVDTFGEPIEVGVAPPTAYGSLYRLTPGGPTGIDADPWQTVNQYSFLTQDSRDALAARMEAIRTASGAALWTLLKTPLPELEFGEEVLDTGDAEQFLVDGVDMSNIVRRVTTSDPTTAPLRGDNLVVPHRAGRVKLIEKLPDEGSFVLNMWAAGGLESGPIPDTVEARGQHRDQIDMLSRVFTNGSYREIRKRFDTSWRAVEGEVQGSINFNTFDERLSRFSVGINAPEGSWRDLNTRTDLLDFDPTEDEDTGLWVADLWFTTFAGSTAPLQDYLLELYGKMFDPIFENIGPGLARPCQYMQHIGAPARLTVDTLAVTAIFDQPDDETFTPFDDIEQIRRPYGSFPILWPRQSDGAYGVRVTVTDQPGRGAQVALTGYRRYQLRG